MTRWSHEEPDFSEPGGNGRETAAAKEDPLKSALLG